MLSAAVGPDDRRLPVAPQPANGPEVWPASGFVTLPGELCYYETVGRDASGKVAALLRCVRGVEGEARAHRPGTPVYGHVVAQHHNQLVAALLNIETAIGHLTEEMQQLPAEAATFMAAPQASLHSRVAGLMAVNAGFDDACPDVQFEMNVGLPVAGGTTAEFCVRILGWDSDTMSYELDFGDGTTTSTLFAGTHVYGGGGPFTPIVTVTAPACTIVQQAAAGPEGYDLSPVLPTKSVGVHIPIPEVPAFPTFVAPRRVCPGPLFNLPPILGLGISMSQISMSQSCPSVDTPSCTTLIPSLISIVGCCPPSEISIVGCCLPSSISISGCCSMPSVISIAGCCPPSVISFEGRLPSTISLEGCCPPSVISYEGCCPPSVISFQGCTLPSVISMACCDLPSVISFAGCCEFPSVVSVVGNPHLPSTIQVVDNIPSIISLVTGTCHLPSVISVECCELPSVISIVNDLPSTIHVSVDVPSTIEVVGHLPSVISVECCEFPSVISVECCEFPSVIRVTSDIPSVISIDGCSFPSKIEVTDSIPSTIELVGHVPSQIEIDVDWGHVPSTIELTGHVPSVIEVDWGDVPRLSIECCDLPSLIRFDAVPTFDPIEFAQPPSFATVRFAEVEFSQVCFCEPPSFAPIRFAEVEFPLVSFDTLTIPSFSAIQFAEPPVIGPVDWGAAPTVNVNWGVPPTLSCIVSLVCPVSSSEFAARAAGPVPDLAFDASIPMTIEDIGIPSEIRIVAPKLPDIVLTHNLPAEIALRVPAIPDIRIVGPDRPLPEWISIVGGLPDVISVVAPNFPRSISLDASTVPARILLEPAPNFPSAIRLEGLPDTLRVTGVPPTIELVGHVPSTIQLLMPEDPTIELVYRGAPLELRWSPDSNLSNIVVVPPGQ